MNPTHTHAHRYEQAARKGDAGAQTQLGRCYELAIGVEANAAEAARLYGDAAGQGWAEAQLKLGRCYEAGR